MSRQENLVAAHKWDQGVEYLATLALNEFGDHEKAFTALQQAAALTAKRWAEKGYTVFINDNRARCNECGGYCPSGNCGGF